MEFCSKVMAPYLRKYDVAVYPVIVTTSKHRCGKKYRGGCINVDRIKNEVSKLLPSFDFVTTFYDFYGFEDRPTDDIHDLEKIIYKLFDDNRFIPYVQKYEFETLLFANPVYFTEFFGNDLIEKEMNKIIQQYQDIELINDSVKTAPSKRIEDLFSLIGEDYDKVFYGEAIASDIGIENMKQKAKRFDDWMKKIEMLGQQ